MLAAIETTGATCGVALFDGKTLRAEMHAEIPRAHDRLLADQFQRLLAAAEIKPSDVSMYAVSVGPGSFTGIRIGIAFALGAVLASNAQLVAVPTLDAIAYNVRALEQTGTHTRVLALVPAGRDTLFGALYEVLPEFRRLTEVRSVLPSHVPNLVDENVRVAGPGIAMLGIECLGSTIRESERLSARSIGRYGQHLFHNGVTTPPGDIRPLYISDFVPRLGREG